MPATIKIPPTAFEMFCVYKITFHFVVQLFGLKKSQIWDNFGFISMNIFGTNVDLLLSTKEVAGR